MNTKHYNKGWLTYRPVSKTYPVFGNIQCLDTDSVIIHNACEELKIGIQSLYPSKNGAGAEIILELVTANTEIEPDGYRLDVTETQAFISATTEKGLLYGAFAFLRNTACEREVPYMEIKNPANFFRMINHWDDIDGRIERGYSGRSFFFENDKLIISERLKDHARLCASVGINAVCINNVNVRGNAIHLTGQEYRKEIKELASIFNGYGIDMYLCIRFDFPILLGGLDTSDPNNEAVQRWWADMAKEFFEDVPGMGGFVIKADSEGAAGPFQYGCTQADGANLLARALKPMNKTLIWRAFVYNCKQDWRDMKIDRARAAYDYFAELDGKFDDNVILQVKNGPADFQVREPVHPLFGAMPNTNLIMEVQIAQEYTGQQRHVCYLVPQWKEILEFRTYCDKENDTVGDIIGVHNGKKLSGICGVINTGDDENWTGHDLAGANWYGYGRMSYDNTLTSEEIAKEWIRMVLGNDETAMEAVEKILMMSWLTYEKYTAPLGLTNCCDSSIHNRPDVDAHEFTPWGIYFRANWEAIGVDRSSKGTGFATLYHSPLKEQYETMETCPEELILFFHRLRYDYVLKSGKTMLQHIYDTHFVGVEEVDYMADLWTTLKGKVDDVVYQRVCDRFEFQKEDSRRWRDVINTYFYRRSGVPDNMGRKIYD